MENDKPVSSLGIMSHLCALYGWMSWKFWNHTSATVIWTLGVIFLLSHFYERMKSKKQ